MRDFWSEQLLVYLKDIAFDRQGRPVELELEDFDAVVDVVQVGVRKPSPEPYLAVAEALGVPASECLFVDDLPVNCRGAEAVGMRSLVFDVTDVRGSLDRLLESLG